MKKKLKIKKRGGGEFKPDNFRERIIIKGSTVVVCWPPAKNTREKQNQKKKNGAFTKGVVRANNNENCPDMYNARASYFRQDDNTFFVGKLCSFNCGHSDLHMYNTIHSRDLAPPTPRA